MINQADKMRGNLIIDRVFLENPINPLSRALASAALAYYVY